LTLDEPQLMTNMFMFMLGSKIGSLCQCKNVLQGPPF
jgi:hypothetical protein